MFSNNNFQFLNRSINQVHYLLLLFSQKYLTHLAISLLFFIFFKSLLTLQWFLMLIIFFHQFSFFKSPSKSKEYFSKRIYFSHLFFKENLAIQEFCFPAENFFSPKRCCVYLRLRGITTSKPKLPEHSSQ